MTIHRPLIIAMLGVLTACSSSKSEEKKDQPASSAPATSEESKPAESKPAETAAPAAEAKPAEAKPAEAAAPAGPSVDGMKLGDPAATVLARPGFNTPCDVDGIGRKTALLYFWSGKACRKVEPAIPGTSLMVLTAYAEDVERTSKVAQAAGTKLPLDFIAWAGPGFDGKHTLGVKDGDDEAAVLAALGTPTADTSGPGKPMKDGTAVTMREMSFASGVHVVMVNGKLACVGIGSLEGSDERKGILKQLLKEHR